MEGTPAVGAGPDGVTFGAQVNPYAEDVAASLELAEQLDASGFEFLTFPDHLLSPGGTPDWEVLTMLGAVSQRTESVDLMPGVVDSVRRHPAQIAHAIATLDQLTDGRATLGIGAGEAFTFAGIEDLNRVWDKPFTRFHEAVTVIRELWQSSSDSPVTFAGEYFDLEETYLGFESVEQPYPPIYIGGYGRKMRSLTGQVADGWIPWIYSPAVYEDDLQRVLKAAEDAGRHPDDIDRSLLIPASVSTSDPTGAREGLISARASSLALRPPLLDAMGYPELADESVIMWNMDWSAERREQLNAVTARLPDEAVDRILVAGSPEDVIEDIQAFLDAGVTHPVFIPSGDVSETVEHFANEIIPHFT